MNKQVATILTMILILLSMTALLLTVGSITPTLEAGSTFPKDLDQQQYMLTGFDYDRGQGGYAIRLYANDISVPLSLTAGDLKSFSFYQNGQLLYQYPPDAPYQRVHILELDPSLVGTDGAVDLLLKTESWGDSYVMAFSRLPSSMPKLMLGASALSRKTSESALGFTMLLIGMSLMLAISSITLFICKKSERYLLVVAVTATIAAAITLVETNVQVLFVPQSVMKIRHHAFLIPGFFNAYIVFSLYKSSIPARMRFVSSRLFLQALCAMLIIIQQVFAINMTYILRFTMLVPVAITLYRAIQKRENGAWLICVGYLGGEIAVRIYTYLTNTLGVICPGEMMLYLRLTQAGNILYLLACIIVVNQRFAGKFKESEQLSLKLEQSNQELDAKVAVRTQELLDEQKKKHRLMCNVFHDLRSPLFLIQGCLDALHPVNAEQQQAVSLMRTRLDFLRHLTEDLFLVAKLENGEVLLEEDIVPLGQMLLSQMDTYQVSMRENNIHFSTQIDPALTVWGDQFHLQQVFQNLVDNAMTYTPSGGSIVVKAAREGNRVHITVSDTGKGIARKDLSFIFQRYYRINRAESRKSSGLGLAIAHDLVVAHHGEIQVASEVGKGTVFTVILPALE